MVPGFESTLACASTSLGRQGVASSPSANPRLGRRPAVIGLVHRDALTRIGASIRVPGPWWYGRTGQGFEPVENRRFSLHGLLLEYHMERKLSKAFPSTTSAAAPSSCTPPPAHPRPRGACRPAGLCLHRRAARRGHPAHSEGGGPGEWSSACRPRG